PYPCVASEADPYVAVSRFLRHRLGEDLPVVYVGTGAPGKVDELDAAMTFADLGRLFQMREVRPEQMPLTFSRVPAETRRHASVAGGLPLEMVVAGSSQGRRILTIRGLEGLAALATAVGHDRVDLGFVDILSHHGSAAHPTAGPRE